MNCNAAHTCSMRCSDPCACPCEQIRHDVVSEDQSPLVPPVVADNFAAESIHALYSAVYSLQSELSENVEIYDAAAWQVWDAPTSDGNANQSTKSSPSKTPVIRELHRPVDLSNGSRQIGRSNAAIFHNAPDISGQAEQNRSPRQSPQPLLNNPEDLFNQPNENFSSAPLTSSPDPDKYATAAQGPLHLPPTLAPDVPYRINDSTKVIGSAQPNSQTYNNGQGTKKSSSKSPSVFKSGRSYSGAPPTTNTKPIALRPMASTTGPVSPSQTRLYVSGVVETDSSASLKQLFTQFGTVLDATVMNDTKRVTSGNPKRFGFVTMASPGQADAAIASLHGARRHGRALNVQKAKPDPNSSNSSPDNPQKHPVVTSKSKENIPGSEAASKKYTPGSKTQPKESDQVLMEFNHPPNDANVERTPPQTSGPSNSNGAGTTPIVTHEQEVTQIQEDDLISFD